MHKEFDRALVWLRRDLRTEDHAALHHALKTARQVWCAFLFDRDILDPLPRRDRRVEFIRDSLVGVDAQLRALGASHGTEGVGLIVRDGRAADALPALACRLRVQAVVASHDDDPAALRRDAAVRGALADHGIVLQTLKDHVIFERAEVLTASGTPYGVFTPYRNAWLKRLDDAALRPHPVAPHAAALAPRPAGEAGVPALASLGFEPTNLHLLRLPTGAEGAQQMLAEFLDGRIDRYHLTRDQPAVKGPSYLGVHLRFGTLSIRQAAREAWQRSVGASAGAQRWLDELIWREFFQQVLHHHPHVVGHPFRAEAEHLRWEHGRHADALFAAWCEGRTGVPLVDAAMQQLNQSGYMHNRLRMVTAGFLCKHLGVDWRRGEAYFAEKLNDFELGSNNGGWQWAASTGCDAQPFFRIFNPVSQSRRHDPDGRFLRRYLPALQKLPAALIHAPWLARPADLDAAGVRLGVDYPAPLVQLDEARERARQRHAVTKAAR